MGERRLLDGLVAAGVLFALAALFWFAQVDWVARPTVQPVDAPATEFSADRAEAILARILGPERPHPVSTAENAAVHARILKEFASLGIPATLYRGFGCNEVRSAGVITCASVDDILGEVKPGAGKAVVLMAHTDSVPAGPGAADDESGVASVIETARALKARGLTGKHPILALLTDGEEAGLLGAAAFLHDPALRARVGAVINVEARGNRGRSLLFQTSPGDGPLTDLYAASVAKYATSSLYAEIYRLLPNDTDLTLFMRDGFPSFNFAFSENIAHYHTSLDKRANLDPQSLQQQGDNLLGVASGLERTNFASLKGGNDIYVDLLGRALPRIGAGWAIPLSMAAFVLLLVAALMARGSPIGVARWCAAFAILPTLVIGAGLIGWLLHAIAVGVSGMADPSYAYPCGLRIALALAVAFMTLMVSRLAPMRAAAAAVWLSLSGLGIVAAVLVPGLTPYFLLPSLVAGLLLLAVAFRPGRWEGVAGQIALLLGALPALLLWIGFGAMGETVMGLKLHPLFTIPVAVGMSTLVPLFAAHSLPRRAWMMAVAAVLVAAVATAIVAGLQPAYSAIAPQRLNVTYVEENNRALWTVDALAPVPPSMKAIAHFSSVPEKISPFARGSSYVAPAVDLHIPLPTARLLTDRRIGNEHKIALALHGSIHANQMALILATPRGLKTVDVNNWHFDSPPQWAKLDRVMFACMSRDCASITLTLTYGNDVPLDAILVEDRFGLPPGETRLLKSRPDTAVPSQNGDGVLLINRLHLAK
ncbi:MAG TPA: M20/M25/M40 family metallo-hydrolase [Rhizomicrobium sp.]